MSKHALVGLALALAATRATASITIDFGPAWGAPPRTIALTNQLAAYGVTFSSISPQGVFWHGDDGYPSSFPHCIGPGWDADGWLSTDPIRIDFDPFVVDVSIRGFDGGGDHETMVLSAFNADGKLVATDSLSSSFYIPGSTTAVAAPEIAYVLVDVEDTTSGLFFDDLSYTFVPVPGPLALLGTGLGLVRYRRRPRSRGVSESCSHVEYHSPAPRPRAGRSSAHSARTPAAAECRYT